MTTLASASFPFVFSCLELLFLFFLLIFLKGRQRRRASRALELFGFNHCPNRLAGFVHGNPESKSSATLVNSQLVCLWPVRILNPMGQNENYWFYSNRVTPIYKGILFIFDCLLVGRCR